LAIKLFGTMYRVHPARRIVRFDPELGRDWKFGYLVLPIYYNCIREPAHAGLLAMCGYVGKYDAVDRTCLFSQQCV
jgi:hypothetical protein